MASGKSQTIDEIDDVEEMIQVMMALGISFKGLRSLDQMITRVKEELKAKPSCGWTPGQVRIRRN